MDVIIIGAGQGGLRAAAALAKGGVKVTLFEKSPRNELCYDWFDDVQTSVFDDLDIPVPEGAFHSDCASLVAPFSQKPMKVEIPEEKRDWAVERRDLSNILAEQAIAAGAELNFSVAVDSLYYEDNKVCGVFINGEAIKASLVIDSSGALSPFRASLPDSYNIQKTNTPEEVFVVYRAFYAPAEGVTPPPVHTKKVYLKHLGESGISWCMVEPTNEINVLVGRTGELSDETLNNALCELKKENPIISDKLLRGGIVCTIPIRYPLPCMVGNGYVAVGDAAFMTIPMIGSGIANSLRAGQMLADAILADNSVSVETLWKYQVRYYKEIGAGHYCVDIIKRMLLSADGADIRYLFDNGVITKEDMAAISSGAKLTMTPAMILKKVIRGRRKLGVLLKLKAAIEKGESTERIALSIPEVYDENAIAQWASKLRI